MTKRSVALGGGKRVPYPEPTSRAATKIGKANRRTGTKPEVRLRSALHRRGLRFRKDPLLTVGELRCKPDIAFPKQKVAVFVDGCFWHCCPDHGVVPRSNRSYWVPKLARNQERDRAIDAALIEHGWLPVRVWEHEPTDVAVDRVVRTVAERTPRR